MPFFKKEGCFDKQLRSFRQGRLWIEDDWGRIMTPAP
jgi:hypothetical protein